MIKKQKILKYLVIIITLFLIINSCVVIIYGCLDKIKKVDVAVVLGNKVNKDGSLSKRLKCRLDEAVRLYKLKIFEYIIVTGGIDPNNNDESLFMKKYLIEHNVPDSKIICDNEGNNTYKSILNVKKIMGKYDFKSIIIISQYFHILRTKIICQKLGITEAYHSYGKNYIELRDLYSIVREIFGIYSCLFKINNN